MLAILVEAINRRSQIVMEKVKFRFVLLGVDIYDAKPLAKTISARFKRVVRARRGPTGWNE
jgi:hypothetical protein